MPIIPALGGGGVWIEAGGSGVKTILNFRESSTRKKKELGVYFFLTTKGKMGNSHVNSPTDDTVLGGTLSHTTRKHGCSKQLPLQRAL